MTGPRCAIVAAAVAVFAAPALAQETPQEKPDANASVAPQTPATDQSRELRWRLAGAEWKGPLSAAAVDATLTARDQRSWNILWQMIGEEAPGPLPDGRMAIAVFRAAEQSRPRQLEFNEIVAGETAMVVGFRSLLTDVSNSGDSALARVEDAPGTGDDTAQTVVTAPYIVRLLPVSQLPVYYVGTVQQQSATNEEPDAQNN